MSLITFISLVHLSSLVSMQTVFAIFILGVCLMSELDHAFFASLDRGKEPIFALWSFWFLTGRNSLGRECERGPGNTYHFFTLARPETDTTYSAAHLVMMMPPFSLIYLPGKYPISTQIPAIQTSRRARGRSLVLKRRH